VSILRGTLNPLIDARAERDPEIQSLLAEVDGRTGERAPTTA
jgi:hypothetical protein